MTEAEFRMVVVYAYVCFPHLASAVQFSDI